MPGGAWLALGGVASLIASAVHLAAIAGGAPWYRFLGAGEGMARAAERGGWRPALVTAAIAGVLAVWGLYALSGAGLIGRMPLLRPALAAITAAYLLRGLVLFFPSALRRPDLGQAFLLWSSLIVLAIGMVHAVGLWRAWRFL